MAMNLTGTGGVFASLGKVAGAVLAANGQIGTTDPTNSSLWGSGGPAIKCLGTAISDIQTQLSGSATLKSLANGLYTTRENYRTQHESYKSDLQTLAKNILLALVSADVSLTNTELSTLIQTLIDQMNDASETVDKNTVSVSVAADSGNTGTLKLRASVVGPNGVNREYVFGEVLRAKVTTDSQSGTATAGAETIEIKGALGLSSELSYLWPQGSGASISIANVDSSNDNSGGNLLTNGDFEDFTGGVPDHWAVGVGTANTTITENTTISMSGNSLVFVGNGSELTSVRQVFNDSTNGTAGTLSPSTVYAVNAWGRVSATTSNGTIALRLLNSSNAVIADDASTSNSVTQALSGLSNTSFTAFGGFFRTPSVMPAGGCKLEIKMTAAADNGVSIYIDDPAMTPATEVYKGGPYVASFAGPVDPIIGDKFDITVSNNKAGTWQQVFQQLFDMRNLGLQLPSASSGTIADSLVS